MPKVRGPLHITVAYPDSNARVDVRDSSFIFGTVGDGTALLLINGERVYVAPNGAWLAWLPFRGDSVATFRIVARTATDSAALDYTIRRVPRFIPRDSAALWVDTTSFEPAGRAWWPGGEFLPLSVRAREGAALTLVLPGGARVPLVAEAEADPVSEGIRAFDRDSLNLVRTTRRERYRSVIRGVVLGDPGPVFGSGGGQPGGEAWLEAVRGADTARVRWPLQLALLDTLPLFATLDDDPLRRGDTDRITVGRTGPGATYTWFFPAGTRARVTGRLNDDTRLALSAISSAWAAASEVFRTPGPSLAAATVGSVTLSPVADRVVVRVPLGARIPFRVEETERTLALLLHGAVSDVNWIRYGAEDSLVALATVQQASADEVRLTFSLGTPVWGYRTRWDGADLLLEIRRPPVLDPDAPLRGRLIALDAGHPPGGATGPTGLGEPEANLGVAIEIRRLLESEGARVLMVRTDSGPVDLWPRVRFADSTDAELLISIHNNALPDGVNPFTNNGSSAFYNHPRALPLARDILGRLVDRTGLRDLGVARGDLALARPTWMPAVLTEGFFIMMPEQEAALRSADGRMQYALAVVEGVRRFLSDRALGR